LTENGSQQEKVTLQMPKDRTCGDCKFHLKCGVCPKAEFKKREDNLTACLPSDPACELFQPKINPENEAPEMGEVLSILNDRFTVICPTDTKEILGFNEGHYVPFETRVHEVLEENYVENLKSYFVEETMKHLQRSNYIERKEINKFTNKIPVKNGLLNLLTRDLEKFTPNEFFTYKLNVEYDPSAECPEWLKFLNETLREEDISLLQEIMGYCLLPEMPFHKLFWFYGTGRNGKDRVIKTLEHILGEENTSHLNLGEFRESRRFSLCQLYGKFLNVSSEPESKYAISTNILKLISGENLIHAELKGKNNRLAFINKAKVIVVGNAFPKVEDSSTGFWERVEVLNFPFSFTGKDCIPNIERKWIPKETSGILNWMLEGLYRLKENGQFSTSKTIEETKAEFMRVSDPFRAWLNDYCVFLPEAYLTRKEAYNSYRDYTDGELGATPDSERTFYGKMRQTPKVRDTRIRIKGKRERVFQGITSKIELEEDEEQTKLETVPDVPDVPDSTYPQKNDESNNPVNIQDKKPVQSGTLGTPSVDIDEALGDGKLPKCFDCKRTIYDPNQLTNWNGHFYCKRCFEKIRAQRKTGENS
jgi:P4 family phage/plasmid primase-like protien